MPGATLGHLEDDCTRSGNDVDVEISQAELDKIQSQSPGANCSVTVKVENGPGTSGIMVLPKYDHLRHGGKILEGVAVISLTGLALPRELPNGTALALTGTVS